MRNERPGALKSEMEHVCGCMRHTDTATHHHHHAYAHPNFHPTSHSHLPTQVKISGVIVSEEAGEQEGAAKNAHHVDKYNVAAAHNIADEQQTPKNEEKSKSKAPSLFRN